MKSLCPWILVQMLLAKTMASALTVHAIVLPVTKGALVELHKEKNLLAATIIHRIAVAHSALPRVLMPLLPQKVLMLQKLNLQTVLQVAHQLIGMHMLVAALT